MNNNDVYLLDSDSFITPYGNYYAFDLVPAYWKQLKNKVGFHSVYLIDAVLNELNKNNDKLTEWLKDSEIPVIRHREQDIIKNYSKVIKHIETCGFYLQEGIDRWLEEDVADPWLIAAAIARKGTIVTLEKSVGQLSTKNKTSKEKIPDVANYFDIKTIDLFEMMRRFEIII